MSNVEGIKGVAETLVSNDTKSGRGGVIVPLHRWTELPGSLIKR